MKTLIRGGVVLTLDRDARMLEGEDVLIENDRIARVGGRSTDRDGPFDRVIDATGHLVMPGLINAHAHSYDVFLRGMWEDMPLEIWMLYGWPAFHPPRSDRELTVRTQLVAAEMLLSGTTACVDNLNLSAMDPHIVGTITQAYHAIGIRACPAPMVGDRPFSETLPYLQEILPEAERKLLDRGGPPTVNAVIEFYREVIKGWDGRDGRVHVLLAPLAPQRCTDDLLVALGTVAQDDRRPLHTHTLETKVQAVTAREFYQKTMIQRLRDLRLISPLLTVIHGVWLSREDIRLLAEGGATVAHNPTCNLRVRSGIAPARQLIEAGVNVALGTDNASANDTYNLFDALKLAALLQNVVGPGVGRYSPAAAAIRMATAGGARSAGLEGEVGVLEAGRRADLIVLDLSTFAFVPFNDPIRQLVYCEKGSSVRTVLVNGRIVVDEGELTTVNLGDLRAEATELAKGLLADNRQVRQQAERLRPYFEQMYRRAVEQDLGFSAFLAPR